MEVDQSEISPSQLLANVKEGLPEHYMYVLHVYIVYGDGMRH